MEIVVEEQNMDGKSVGTISVQGPLRWKVYVDGIANHRGSIVGLVLISPEKIIIEKSLRLGSRPQTMKPNMRLYCKEWPWYRKWGERQWKCSPIRDWLWAK